MAAGFLWNALDQVVRVGVPRLIFFPVVLGLIGPASFGDFVVALAIGTLIGASVTVGFSNHLLKEASDTTTASLDRITRVAAVWTLLLTVVLMSLACAALLPLGRHIGGDHLLFWLVVVAVHYLFVGPTETLMVRYRVQRDFRRMTLVHATGVVALLLALPLYPMLGTSTIVLALLGWAVVPAFVVLGLVGTGQFALSSSEPGLDARSVFHQFVGGFVERSVGYMDRVMLAIWWPPEQVTIFFSAISLSLLFQAPAAICASFTLSVIARVSIQRLLGRRLLLAYTALALAAGFTVFASGTMLGNPLLALLYAEQYEQAVELLEYGMGAAGLMTTSTFLRPFVIKLRPSQWISRLSAASLVCRVALIALLVPAGGYLGAARALLYGSLATAIIWLLAYLFVLRVGEGSGRVVRRTGEG